MRRVPNALLAQLSELVSDKMGLHFTKSRWLDLLRGFRSASEEFGFHEVEDCIHWLLAKPLSKKQIEILARHLTVGETYFMREPKIFDALERHIFPEIIQNRRFSDKRIRIWSAACCTGEEPYSLAIVLSRMIPDIANWNIRILATDINPSFLNKANLGIYRQWSFRGAPYWLKENYFQKTKEGIFEIHQKIKQMVTFEYLNLVEDTYPALMNDTNAMDIVFCRNVLMYFNEEQVTRVIKRFHHCLLDKGWLIVGSSETSHIFYQDYVSVNFPGAICYRKSEEEKGAEIRFKNMIEESSSDYDLKTETLLPFKIPLAINSDSDEEHFDQSISSKKIEQEVDQEIDIEEKSDRYEENERLLEQGFYEQTVENMINMIEKDNMDAKSMTLLAKAYANQGRLNDALMWSEKALEIDKLNPEFHHLNAVILQEQGHLEDAVKALKKTIYLEPNFILAHYMLGNLSRQSGQVKESKKHFENTLHLLRNENDHYILPKSEGITAGRLREFIQAMSSKEYHA